MIEGVPQLPRPDPDPVHRLDRPLKWDELGEWATMAASALERCDQADKTPVTKLSFAGSLEWALVLDHFTGQGMYGTNSPVRIGETLFLPAVNLPFYEGEITLSFKLMEPATHAEAEQLAGGPLERRARYFKIHLD